MAEVNVVEDVGKLIAGVAAAAEVKVPVPVVVEQASDVGTDIAGIAAVAEAVPGSAATVQIGGLFICSWNCSWSVSMSTMVGRVGESPAGPSETGQTSDGGWLTWMLATLGWVVTRSIGTSGLALSLSDTGTDVPACSNAALLSADPAG
jgi:hypothetical protein